jgi:hypothetical protein
MRWSTASATSRRQAERRQARDPADVASTSSGVTMQTLEQPVPPEYGEVELDEYDTAEVSVVRARQR